MAKYTDLCNQILENVGGKENVSQAVHCMTRLRLNLKDRSQVDMDAVKGIKGVLGAQFSGEQFQIIIGQHVSEVYPEFCGIAGLGQTAAIDENLDNKEPFDIKKVPAKILDYVSGSIAPTLSIMMGAGFFKMFYAILGPDLLNLMANESPLMQTLYIVGNAGFYFMPIFVAWGAAKKLNTSVALAMLLSCLLIDPNILNIVTAEIPVILRPGYITQKMLSDIVGETEIDVTVYDSDSRQAPKAPGMKYRHYAPKGELVIVEGEPHKVVQYINEQCAAHEAAGARTGVIGTKEQLAQYHGASSIKNAGSRYTPEAAAKQLYTFLREFDDEGISYIYAESFAKVLAVSAIKETSDTGIGQAIMNRLLKAAGHKVIYV